MLSKDTKLVFYITIFLIYDNIEILITNNKIIMKRVILKSYYLNITHISLSHITMYFCYRGNETKNYIANKIHN